MKHKHTWEDLGLGYFVNAGYKKIWFSDSASMTSDLHHFQCIHCDKEEYRPEEPKEVKNELPM